MKIEIASRSIWSTFFWLITLVCLGWNAEAARGQDDRDEDAATAQAEDASIKEELAKIDQVWGDGKKKKATDMVRDLYTKTGNLRAGYALSQVLQTQAEEQIKRTPKKISPFVTEGAELARKLLADPKFPKDFRPEVRLAILNEARNYSGSGDQAAALKSIRELVSLGYTELDELESDRLLKELAKTDEFQTWIAEVRQEIRERNMKWARAQMDKFETFPFDFNQSDVKNQPISLNSLQGKVVIVDFWGTWCPPCRKEIPSYIALKEKYYSDLEIVGLAYEKKETDEEKVKSVVDFAKKNKINYICALGNEYTQRLVPQFRGYPTTLFIDRQGKVRMMKVGAYSYEQMEAILLALIEDSAS
jgi:thiol-disulfide isomerase/thioredoxin